MAVPVRPVPPSHAISTLAVVDLSNASRSTATAAPDDLGRRKSGHGIHRDSHAVSG